MASVTILREWPDGDRLKVHIKIDASYPDAVAEAKRVALDAYFEALTDTLRTSEEG